MKVLHLSANDVNGGAAIAAYRLHQGLLHEGVDSVMYVLNKLSKDPTVLSVQKNPISRIMNKALRFLISRILRIIFSTKNKTTHSAELISRIDIDFVKEINPDIINLHWICADFIKPEDLPKLSFKPLVWTMHDMWPFAGAEHYTMGDKRYEERYSSENRPEYESGLDICKLTWERKEKAFKKIPSIHIISPSRWLANCAKKSFLFKKYPIVVIPNGLDIHVFKPIDKKTAREILNMPLHSFVILFGADGGTNDPRKGYRYLEKALAKLKNENHDREIELMVFGQNKPEDASQQPFQTHYTGKIENSHFLALIYSVADVFVAPSTEDNLPNTILESLACGTPVVAFGIGGMPDAISHGINGYLAKPFESDDLANGIKTVMNKKESDYLELSKNARRTAEEKFVLTTQAKNYIRYYEKLISHA